MHPTAHPSRCGSFERDHWPWEGKGASAEGRYLKTTNTMLLLLGLLRVAIVQNFMFMVGFEAVQDLGFFPSVWTPLSPHRQCDGWGGGLEGLFSTPTSTRREREERETREGEREIIR